MALTKKVVDIKFNRGVDTGRDPKTVIPSKFTRVENLETDRVDSLRQRPGYSAVTANTGTLAPDLLNINQLHTLGAEVLLETGGAFYSLAQDQLISRDGIDAVGVDRRLERARIDFTDVAARSVDMSQLDAAVATPSALECWVWRQDTAGASSGLAELRYQVVDGKTRSVLVEGQLAAGTSTLHFWNPRVLVRNVGTASRFYIYYSSYDSVAVQSDIWERHIDIGVGLLVPQAITAAVSVTSSVYVNAGTDGAIPFDAWYDDQSDVIALAFADLLQDLELDIVDGTDGNSVLFANIHATTLLAVSVTVVYNGATGYALAVYNGAGAYSTTLAGGAPLATTIVATASALNTRMAVMPSPFTAGKALVFYDRTLTGYDPVFPSDIGYVQCNYDGSAPAAESIFARGVELVARPAVYNSEGLVDVCVSAILNSTVQPTIFMLKFGGSDKETLGFGVLGTLATGTHVPPRVLARVLPGRCAVTQGYAGAGAQGAERMPSAMDVVA